MSVKFKFDRFCGVGTVTIKPIWGYYSKLGFYGENLGELNDFMADDLIYELWLDDFLGQDSLYPRLVASNKTHWNVLEEHCIPSGTYGQRYSWTLRRLEDPEAKSHQKLWLSSLILDCSCITYLFFCVAEDWLFLLLLNTHGSKMEVSMRFNINIFSRSSL